MPRLFSPAKVNLFLRVLNKRKDGAHDIETLFERIDLFDVIDLKPSPGAIRIKTSGERVPSDRRNLAYQAARLLKETYRVPKGATITIKKRIPVSAGLGGGSSNAATVLLGLNRLWDLNLSKDKLMKLGARLGSDVPFFIMETSFAVGRGRGERLKKVPRPDKKIWHVLVKPSFGISTKEAYGGLKGPFLTFPKVDVKILFHSIQKGHSNPLSMLLTNSLEVPLNKRVIKILELKKNLLKQGALAALMSGSGSTVFGIFSSRSKARKAAGRLRKIDEKWKVFVAATY